MKHYRVSFEASHDRLVTILQVLDKEGQKWEITELEKTASNGHDKKYTKPTDKDVLRYTEPKAKIIVEFMKAGGKDEYHLDALLPLADKMAMKRTSMTPILSQAVRLNLIKRTRKGHYAPI